MDYLFVASGSLTIFIIALVLGKKSKTLSDYILIFWFLIFVINFISLFILNRATFPLSFWEKIILEFSEVSIFIHGPILWFYTLSLTKPNFRFKPEYMFHAIPFCLSYVYFLVNIHNNNNESILVIRNILLILKMLSLLIYLIFVILKLSYHRSNVENIFSNVEEKYLGWLAFLSWAIMAIWGIAFLSLMIDRSGAITVPQYGGLVTNIAISLFVFIMGYFGFKQPSVFVQEPLFENYIIPKEEKHSSVNTTVIKKYSKSGLDIKRSKEIHEKLLDLLEMSKPYLEKELTLYKLAKQLNVQPNQLSQVINSVEGHNFFDFINFYRVEAAKDKIQSDEFRKLTLLGIALDSGFNSKASFNRVFKKFTNQTPTNYRKSLNHT